MFKIQALMGPKKGQVAVLDLFIAALIFSIIVTAIMFTWNSYNVKIEDQIEYNTNLVRAYHISDLLVRYAGKPSAWEHYGDLSEDAIEIVGLAERDHIIDPDKLNSFMNLSYDYVRTKLKINEYQFYMDLKHINGSDFNPPIEFGNQTNESSIISLRRYVIYNDTEAILGIWIQE